MQHATRRLSESVCLVASSVLLAATAFAQSNGVDDVHAQLAAIAHLDGVEQRLAVQDIYREFHEQSDRSGVEVIENIRYGIFDHQRLDLHIPEDRGDELLPVVIFVHGGNLDTGDKNASEAEQFLYGNVATFFARNGFIGVNANYRLVPEIVFPQGAEDMREIIGWLITENAESYGGDPNAMFMIGASGGARHVASYLFHRTSQTVRGTWLLGAVLISPWLGISDVEPFTQYYGDLEAQAAALPTALVESYDPERPRVPVMLLSGEFDPPRYALGTADMYAALCHKYNDCPRIQQLPSHNRFSAVVSFNTPDDSVSGSVLEFIRELYETRQNQ